MGDWSSPPSLLLVVVSCSSSPPMPRPPKDGHGQDIAPGWLPRLTDYLVLYECVRPRDRQEMRAGQVWYISDNDCLVCLVLSGCDVTMPGARAPGWHRN
jgi:hypothetical protein